MTDSNQRLGTIKAALDDIGAAGDAARLQIHLLSLRARERTGGLATSIEALERRLDRSIEQAVQTAASKTRQLSSAVQDLLGQAPEERETFGTVRAIMSEAPASCAPEDPAHRAAQLMWDADCGAIPVVDAEGKVVGIVTDRDLCMAAYTKGLPLSAIAVGDVMAHHVSMCHAEDPLERAAAVMADAQVRRLPVVDRERRLIGMVSLADIANGAPVLGQREGAELTSQLLRAISQRPRTPIAAHGHAAE